MDNVILALRISSQKRIETTTYYMYMYMSPQRSEKSPVFACLNFFSDYPLYMKINFHAVLLAKLTASPRAMMARNPYVYVIICA